MGKYNDIIYGKMRMKGVNKPKGSIWHCKTFRESMLRSRNWKERGIWVEDIWISAFQSQSWDHHEGLY